MEPNVISTATTSQLVSTMIGDRIIRRDFYPLYGPPFSNYRRLSPGPCAAFWSAFRVTPGDGGTVNQLGTNTLSSAQQSSQEVGFGYTFQAYHPPGYPITVTDYWFDVAVEAGPISLDCAKGSIQLQMLDSRFMPAPGIPPVETPLSARYVNTTLTLAASLLAGKQYTLLFNSKVEISLPAGGHGYGEVIAKFPKLTVSYLRPAGFPLMAEGLAVETLDLNGAHLALKAADERAEVLLQSVSYKEIAQAGAAGFGAFRDGN
ncbi:MAG: hypothetical protein ABJC13_09380 [Acidobacteriota bacterium]